ncbi:MAG: 50S ribosomal protein L19 [Rhabdochlamydiaceae bacterium]
MIECKLIETIEKQYLKSHIPSFRVGDTISVHTRIVEGDKERIQVFTGTVIARKGRGLSETFSLYRVAYGSGMERVFTLHSPKIAKIELVSRGDSRLAKLYYIRGALGKKAKIKKLQKQAKTVSSKTVETALNESTQSS